MADQERQRSRSSRPRHPSERSIEADAQRREQLGSLCDAALHEADALLVTLRELQLISKSSRPDRRTIAFAVASKAWARFRKPQLRRSWISLRASWLVAGCC